MRPAITGACFKKAGWATDTFITDFLSHERKFTLNVLFVPCVDALLNWTIISREWVGMIAYKVMGYV
jgi:hypothetical protein